MKKYQSHKIVEAVAIEAIIKVSSGFDISTEKKGFAVGPEFFARGVASPGDYLVRYQPDGYLSWSPKAVFEAGYREVDEQGTPAAVEVTVKAPAGKRAIVIVTRDCGNTSKFTVTGGQRQTWDAYGGDVLSVREGEPHSTVDNKRYDVV